MTKGYILNKLNATLDECEKHLARMNGAYARIEPFFLLDEERYDGLSDEQIAYIDQFLFRFSKLQDAMGERLFRGALVLLDEEIEGKSFADILNKLEKLLLIESAEGWRELRNIRNSLAHQYDNDPSKIILALNAVFGAKANLEKTYLRIKLRIKTEIAKIGELG